MTDRLEVVITGKNGISRVFQEVTHDAQKMGDGVDAAAKKGGRGLDDLKKNATEIGAALGATIGVVSLLGQSYVRQEQEVGALNRIYGSASEEIVRFTEVIQDNTTASNDQARQAAITAGTLVQNYGFTAAEIEKVISTSADLAAVTGLTLNDATQRVAAALRGEAESAEVLGLTLNQQSIDRNNLTLTMSNEEAAHFRLNALLEQSAFAEGAAGDKAASHAGQARQLVNQLQDVAQSAGGALGPISEYASVLGSLALAAPVAGAGLGKIGPGVASLAGLLGPAGLTAAVLGAGAAFIFLSDHTQEWEDAAESASTATLSLNDQIARLAASGRSSEAGSLKEINDQWSLLAKNGAEIEKRINEVNIAISDIENRKSNAQPPLDVSSQLDLSEEIAQLQIYREQLERLALSSDDINAITLDIQNLFAKPGIDAAKAAQDIEYYFDLFEQGAIDQQTLVRYIDESATDWTRYSVAVVQSADAQKLLNEQMAIAADAMNVQSGDLNDLLDVSNLYSAARMELSRHMAEGALASQQESISTRDLSARMEDLAPKTDAANTFLAEQADILLAVKDAVDGYRDALGLIPSLADTGLSTLATRAGASGQALGDAFRVGVGNTSALGQQAQGIDDWARKLINVKGEYGQIDTLLKHGTISVDEYNDAQLAGTRIFQANKAIQEDILKIQTDQAPIIAEMTMQQRRYLDEIAALPADQQAVALAYMDSEESAKALSAAQLAAAAAAGELGTAGEETATKMITAAAKADPYLAALLEDMGLITIGADGTITVNFDSVTEAGASLDDVVDAIGTLTELIAEIFRITIESNADEERDALQGVIDHLNSINGKEARFYVTEVRSSLGVSLGSPSGVGFTERNGGVVGYAMGGLVRGAEAGPEWFTMPNGRNGFLMTDGLYNLPVGTMIDTAPVSRSKGRNLDGGQIVIQGDLHLHMDDPNVYAAVRESAIGSSR